VTSMAKWFTPLLTACSPCGQLMPVIYRRLTA
jgi:hypothetical protein